jgi:uncharacterized protein (DUF58 family)
VILDYRNYRPGDPLKDIDWKISARTEKLFVKIREGNRQTDFVVAVDGSESMKTDYGDPNGTKFITALTLAYIAGRVALSSRDRLFLNWANERIRIHSETALLNTLIEMEFGGEPHDFWNGEIETTANLFLISDFFTDIERVSLLLRSLSHFTKNLFVLSIHDPSEEDLMFDGRFRFLDPESDRSLLIESSEIRQKYNELYAGHFFSIARQCKSFGARTGRISTGDDPLHAFVKAVS